MDPNAKYVRYHETLGNLYSLIIALTVLIVTAIIGKSSLRRNVVFSRYELSVYNANSSEVIYLGIMGEVYDVSSGDFYRHGGGYDFFVGVDASRAFITGDFQNDLNDNVTDFDEGQCKGLVDWRNFYRDHQVYKQIGTVIGLFYDEFGQGSDLLTMIEQKARIAEQWETQKKQLEKDVPSCNKRWSAKSGGEVWCEDGYYPRLVEEKYGEDKFRQRCACFNRPGWSDVRKLYPNCNPTSSRCSTSKKQD